MLKVCAFGKNVALYSRWRCNQEWSSIGADTVPNNQSVLTPLSSVSFRDIDNSIFQDLILLLTSLQEQNKIYEFRVKMNK